MTRNRQSSAKNSASRYKDSYDIFGDREKPSRAGSENTEAVTLKVKRIEKTKNIYLLLANPFGRKILPSRKCKNCLAAI